MKSESGDNDIAQLLARSGPRQQPSMAARQRVHDQLLDVWEQLPEGVQETPTRSAHHPGSNDGPRARVSRLRPARPAYLALAAAVGVVVVGAWLGRNQLANAPQVVAEIAYSTGGYAVTPAGDGSSALLRGATVRTSDEGRLLLSLSSATTVRLDQNSRATLRSSDEIYLHSGRLYIDSHGGSNDLRISTPGASITKVGTQFEVTVTDQMLEVAVREGQVNVRRGNEQALATASAGVGEVLHYDAQGRQTKVRVATTDPERWRWTQLSRPNFDMDQGSYYDYLSWAARERGLILEFTDEVLEQFAKSQTGAGHYDASDQDIEQALRTESYYARLPSAPHELLVGRRQDH